MSAILWILLIVMSAYIVCLWLKLWAIEDFDNHQKEARK